MNPTTRHTHDANICQPSNLRINIITKTLKSTLFHTLRRFRFSPCDLEHPLPCLGLCPLQPLIISLRSHITSTPSLWWAAVKGKAETSKQKYKQTTKPKAGAIHSCKKVEKNKRVPQPNMLEPQLIQCKNAKLKRNVYRLLVKSGQGSLESSWL